MDTHDSYKTNLPARFSRPAPPAVPDHHDGASEATRPLNLRVILRGLARYWWQMSLIWLVATSALLTVIYFRVKPSYEAVSLLMAEPSDSSLFTPTSNAETDAFLETQVNLIKSTAVLSAATVDPKAAKLARLQTAEDPVIELRTSLDVQVRPRTFLIQVAMRSASPEEASTLVNAVVDAYINANLKLSEGATNIKVEKLTEAMRGLEKQEGEHKATWKHLANKTANAQLPTLVGPGEKEGANNGKGNHSITMKEYEEIKANERKIKTELFDAEALLKYLESQPRAVTDSRASREKKVEEMLALDPDLAKINEKLNAVESQIRSLESRSRNGVFDHSGRRLIEQKAQLEGQFQADLAAKQSRYRASVEAGGAAPGNDPRAEARARVAILREKERGIAEELKQIQILSRQEAGDAVDIFVAQQELASIKAMKQSVVNRLEDLKFAAKGGAKIVVADKAVTPNKPASNSRPKLLLAAPFGVLAALMSLFVLLEIRSGRVGHPDELSPRMRAEVFSVPPLPTLRAGRGGRGRGDQVEEFTQRVDHLRVALCGETHDGVARCVLITSAAGGEGKTTLAAQLAGRCANAGLSTLLIDADLRRPRLGQILDVPEGPGLSDVLSGEAEVESALVVIGNAGGFHLLPAGTPAPDPSRLLRGRRLGDLIGRLRQTFDIVILDTPPVLPVPDALTMGEWVDGAVLAVRRDASRVSLVERANRMLSAKGIPLLGVVVNGVKTSDMGYGGYSGYMSYASVAQDAYPQTPAATPVTSDED